MKRKLCTSFRHRIVEAVIVPNRLVYEKWLDFGTREIDWDMWENPYGDALDRRRKRGATVLPEIEADILITMLEGVAFHVACSASYVGGIELQILTHSMISYRFTSTLEGSWGDRFHDAIEEIIDNVRTSDDRRFAQILLEISRRVRDMHSPIVNCEFLCYPLGNVIGVNQPVNY